MAAYRNGTFTTDQSVWDAMFYNKCAGWELKFAFLPKRCDVTGRKIWLEYAYRGSAWFRVGDIDIQEEIRWHDKLEHIIWKLKR